jgi:hypothetical protein
MACYNIWYQSAVRPLQAVICCCWLPDVFCFVWTSRTCGIEKIRHKYGHP